MTHATDPQNNSEDLDALFDNAVKGNPQAVSSETPHDAVAQQACNAGDSNMDKVLSRVGQLTRLLHNNLREISYDKLIEKAAEALPDARDRLNYIATMTEQAALRVLNATDIARPIQDKLAADAKGLSTLWQKLCDRQLNLDEFKDLVTRTRTYLDDVPSRTGATSAQLMEIMMAQDFQDLTGQVIKKITDMVQTLEQELVRLLLDYIPPEKRSDPNHSLLNGPVVNPEGRNDVVTGQNQVDELLESLGF
ncbi:MAG: protein phosphatase CheZ [Gallionellaceae bacterium]|nr:protein phosphatase CheZ [Gallionellaceae bacterium]